MWGARWLMRKEGLCESSNSKRRAGLQQPHQALRGPLLVSITEKAVRTKFEDDVGRNEGGQGEEPVHKAEAVPGAAHYTFGVRMAC